MDLLGVELEISTHPDRSFKLRAAIKYLFAKENDRFWYYLRFN